MTVLEQAMGLPRSEKLRLMEALWTDLSLVEAGVDSPGWHGAALRETEARVSAGEEQQMDWDEAKRLLRLGPFLSLGRSVQYKFPRHELA